MNPQDHKLFSNVATSKNPYFYKENGDPDFKKVQVFLSLSNSDLAKISKISLKSVRFEADRMPPALKERIREIMNICELAAEMLGGNIERTQLWFTTKNNSLGNISPRDMIRFGRYGKLLDILMDIKSGNIP